MQRLRTSNCFEPIREPSRRGGPSRFAPRTAQNQDRPRRFSDRLFARRWLLAALLSCLALPACARWNWRGDGFHDDGVNDAAKLRKATGGQKAGLDNRAREIENDLGVR